MFWGIFFIAFGLIMVIEHFFPIHIPIFKILIATLFVYIGLKILFGSFGSNIEISKVSSENQSLFSTTTFKFSPSLKEYQVVFGKGTLDLTQADVSQTSIEIQFNTVFGDSEIIVNNKMPIRIESNTAFGSTRYPNKDITAFGKYIYTSDSYKEGQAHLQINSNVVFGSLHIKNSAE